MHVVAIRIEVHIPDAASLKDKRRVLRPFVEGLRGLASVSVAEIGFQDTWQRSVVGAAVVAADATSLDAMVERIRRYVDEQVELQPVDVRVIHMEADDG